MPSVSRVIGPDRPVRQLELALPSVGRGRNIAPPMPERPLSPWVMSTTSHWPVSIAAAAWRRCTRFEHPPTIVASTQRASMPSEWATNVGRYGWRPLIATPSTSAGCSPQSSSARRAASVASAERRRSDGADLGGLGGADDRDPGRGHDALGRNTGQRGVADRLEHDLDRQIEGQRVGIGIHLDQVREQARTLVELDHRDHVRRGRSPARHGG